MNRLPKNIEARAVANGSELVLYVRATVKGKRIYQSTGLAADPGNMEAAKRIRDAILREAHENRFAELHMTKMRESDPCATIGEIIDRYEDLCAVRRDVVPATRRENVAALVRVVSRGCGVSRDAVRALRASVLTDELVEKFAAVGVEAAGEVTVDLESAQRTVNATLRHARALFKKDIVRQYRGMKLPDLRPFAEAFGTECPRVRYELPDAEEYTKIIEAARTKLRVDRPDLYAAFLLCFDLALRADEAANARWSWIEHEDVAGRRRLRMAIVNRPGEEWKPKGRGGAVPVADGVMAALEAAAPRGPGPYILPGETRQARYELAMQGLADWMRGLGWQRRKCAHELRKLKGSFWRARSGLDRAFEWLRHATYQTTVDYYARIPLRDEPHRIDAD